MFNSSFCSIPAFQVGAISSQNMPHTLQSIRDCLENSDWATRKAAADTLCVLATHSGHLIGDGAAPTIAALEACRFDKVPRIFEVTLNSKFGGLFFAHGSFFQMTTNYVLLCSYLIVGISFHR
jgi:hypothetical protein